MCPNPFTNFLSSPKLARRVSRWKEKKKGRHKTEGVISSVFLGQCQGFVLGVRDQHLRNFHGISVTHLWRAKKLLVAHLYSKASSRKPPFMQVSYETHLQGRNLFSSLRPIREVLPQGAFPMATRFLPFFRKKRKEKKKPVTASNIFPLPSNIGTCKEELLASSLWKCACVR